MRACCVWQLPSSLRRAWARRRRRRYVSHRCRRCVWGVGRRELRVHNATSLLLLRMHTSLALQRRRTRRHVAPTQRRVRGRRSEQVESMRAPEDTEFDLDSHPRLRPPAAAEGASTATTPAQRIHVRVLLRLG